MRLLALLALVSSCATAPAPVKEQEAPKLRLSQRIEGERVIAIIADQERWPLTRLLEARGVRVPTAPKEALGLRWAITFSSCADPSKPVVATVSDVRFHDVSEQARNPTAGRLLLVARPATECDALMHEVADAVADGFVTPAPASR